MIFFLWVLLTCRKSWPRKSEKNMMNSTSWARTLMFVRPTGCAGELVPILLKAHLACSAALFRQSMLPPMISRERQHAKLADSLCREFCQSISPKKLILFVSERSARSFAWASSRGHCLRAQQQNCCQFQTILVGFQVVSVMKRFRDALKLRLSQSMSALAELWPVVWVSDQHRKRSVVLCDHSVGRRDLSNGWCSYPLDHWVGDTKLLRTVLAVARMLCFQPKKRISKPKSARIELTYSVSPSYNDIDFSQVWPAPRMSWRP